MLLLHLSRMQIGQLSVDDLIRMYESDGITPDFLKESGLLTEFHPHFTLGLQIFTPNRT